MTPNDQSNKPGENTPESRADIQARLDSLHERADDHGEIAEKTDTALNAIEEGAEALDKSTDTMDRELTEEEKHAAEAAANAEDEQPRDGGPDGDPSHS